MARKWCIPLLTLLLFASEARAEVVLILRREAQPAGNYVRICDIARVEGPKEQAQEVAATVLGPVPGRGQSQEFTRWDVENRLYEMGIGLRVTFSGNDVVRVYGDGAPRNGRLYDPGSFQTLEPVPLSSGTGRRSATGGFRDDDGNAPAGMEFRKHDPIVKPDPKEFKPTERPAGPSPSVSGDEKARLGQVVAAYLADRYRQNGVKRPDIEVEAKIASVNGAIPDGAYDVSVAEALDGRVPGRALLSVVVKDTAEAAPRRLEVAADTEVYGKTLVASRNINRGETMEKRDVTVTRVRMDAGKGYFPPTAKSVEGRETVRQLRPGEPILASDTVPGMAVKRGDAVVVDTSGKGWQVQGKAKALGTGMVGDLITVEDSSSKTKFTARITSRGKVEVVIKKAPYEK